MNDSYSIVYSPEAMKVSVPLTSCHPDILL